MRGMGATIDRNLITGNSCSGDTQWSASLINAYNSTSTITNNVMADNTCDSVIVSDQSATMLIANNTFVRNPRALRLRGGTVTFTNNLVAESGQGVWVDVPVPVSFSNNLMGLNGQDYVGIADQAGSNGNLHADPQLVHSSQGDFRLASTSPAIDTGLLLGSPTVDHDGSSRPLDGPDLDNDAEVDIGAFEHDGTEPPSVPVTGVLDRSWTGDGDHQLPSDYHVPMLPTASNQLFTAAFREADSTSQFRVSKFEAEGSPGAGFGTNGTIMRNFAVGFSVVNFPVLLTPSGTGLLVVGDYYGTTARLGMAKLRADGTYDPTFSADGRALYKVFTSEHDVVTAWRAKVLNGGKIGLAVAALDYDANGVLRLTGQSILRLNANGTADTSFSGDARIPIGIDYSDVAFLPSGALYAGRQVGTVHEIRKFTTSGAKDTGFSGDSIVAVNCSTHRGANLTADPSGRPVLMCVRVTGGTLNLGLYRYTTSGAVDTTYSGDGKTALVATGGTASGTWSLEFDDAARPWVAIQAAASPTSALIYSLDANGSPNAGWSDDGKAALAFEYDVGGVRIGDIEKGPSRLYIEDHPDNFSARITAMRA
jgi:hypothetical protein